MNTNTRLLLGFGIQVLITFVLGVSAYLGVASVQRQFQSVAEHDARVIANARHLSKLVVDMETGQRGFVITGKEEFLEPYRSGADEFDLLLEREKQLVRDDPKQLLVLERVENLVAEWKKAAAEPEIAMARKVATHQIDAEHLERTLGRAVGKKLMDSFMALGHEIEVSFSERGDWEGAFAVEIIEKSMADREDGQRGFLITGREEFLEKYVAGEQKQLPTYFANLRAIVSQRGRDNELSGKIDQLEALAREWTTKAAEPEIDARREMNEHPETLKDVAALLQSGTGKALIDNIRVELDGFVRAEAALAAEHYATSASTTAATQRTVSVLMVIGFALAIVIAFVTSRAIATPPSVNWRMGLKQWAPATLRCGLKRDPPATSAI